MKNLSPDKFEEAVTDPDDVVIRRRRDFLPWALVLPAVLYLLIVNLYPLIYVFRLSFTRYAIASTAPPVFNGIENFKSVLTTPRFWASLKVTVGFSFLNVVVQLVLGFVVALLLNNMRRGRQLITTLLLLPMMIAPAIVAFIWKMIYNPYWGPLNYMLQQVGIEGRSWASDPVWALPALLVADIWQWTPFMIILLLAGLQSLPRSVYEAAYIDGSSPWQVFRNITLPLMYPFIYLAFILRVIDSFKIFDLVYIVTKGGPGTVTENLGWFTYETGFVHFNIGWASALSVVQLIIIIVVAQYALKALSRPVAQEATTAAEEEVQQPAAVAAGRA